MFTFQMEHGVTKTEAQITFAGKKQTFRITKIYLISIDEYFRKHQCLSSARGARSEKGPDLNVNVNARPDGDIVIPPDAEAYFSLDSNVKFLSLNSVF